MRSPVVTRACLTDPSHALAPAPCMAPRASCHPPRGARSKDTACSAPRVRCAAPRHPTAHPAHQARAVVAADALADSLGSAVRPGQRPMLAPLSKAEGEAAVAFVSESGGVGVDNTFFGKFGERVEDLVVRLEPPPPPVFLRTPHAYPTLHSHPHSLPQPSPALSRSPAPPSPPPLPPDLHPCQVRLEPLVLELEGSTTPVLIIAQEAPCARTSKACHRRGRAAHCPPSPTPPHPTPPTPPYPSPLPRPARPPPPSRPASCAACGGATSPRTRAYCPPYNTPGAACCAPTCSVQSPPRWRSVASPTPPSSRRPTRRSRARDQPVSHP